MASPEEWKPRSPSKGKATIFGERFRADFFGAQYGHYLQIRTSESRNKLVEMAGHLVKLGADEEIEQLMSRALPGVKIEPIKGPVPGLAEGPT